MICNAHLKTQGIFFFPSWSPALWTGEDIVLPTVRAFGPRKGRKGALVRACAMDPTRTASLLLVLVTGVAGFWYTPQGPQIYSCLTYIEKNLRVDCEFPITNEIPGPFCEFKQDGRIIGTTYPNTPSFLIPTLEFRRRANVSLVSPSICRLTWAPMADERSYTYTCRVYQGSTWKENSMAFHQRNVLVCSAVSWIFHAAPWLLGMIGISLPVCLGSLSA
ncbi:uncharacterized protein LOC114791801 isoform X3 [Denticeps clupeoides]|uniref:uncharacterized protein LOC114791801 isoform X3 n=1 Tax=Denticeps clupeoides TaxID=299321 RepID=UPI0010A55213|nr:uncharacterized protein LOC114791801 isoform X3 [Denticeps clupeoides]